MDYENETIRPNEHNTDQAAENRSDTAYESAAPGAAAANDAHYVGGVSSQPYVDRVYEPIRHTAQPAGGGVPPEYTTYNAAPAQPPKKPEKRGRGTVPALVLVLCMVMSVALGFGGGILANSYLKQDTAAQTPQTTQETQNAQNDDSSSNHAQATLPESVARTDSNALSVSEVAAKVADAVVEISTESVTTSNYMQQYVTEGAGSGVIVSSDGTILTCNHVIEGASKITVRLRSGESYDATVVAADDASDVAILKIEATGLTAAPMGDSDALSVGEQTVVIGNPLGALGGSITTGILSASEREITINNEKMTLLQTDAAINPGNSGGGMFDAYGNLIGIVVAKSSGTTIEGLGFAIPINTVKDVYEQLIDNGYVTGRAVLGVTMTEQQAVSLGSSSSRAYVIVTAVSENSPAAEAGIQPGDIILSIDDQEVTSAASLKSYIRECSVGDSVQLVLLRGNNTVTVTATLAESRPES